MAKETPRFKVTATRFFDGQAMHEPGTEIAWEAPPDWNAAKNGPHFTANGPSLTFEPLNEAAKALLEHHVERIKKAAVPASSEVEELKKMVAKQNEQITELLKATLELQKKR